MKVIKTDNFDRESFSDEVVGENLTAAQARTLADELNDGLNPNSPYWHTVVGDDYKPFVRSN